MKKIAITCICLNQPYWQYIQEMVNGLNRFFLKEHSIRDNYEIELLVWTDIPSEYIHAEAIKGLKLKIVPSEAADWPLPTLMRYNLYLQEEEHLKDFDYIFHIDVDMQIVDWIGEEILGNGLTAALHPMYHLKKNYWPPYEPNENSKAYIKRPGKVINDDGKPRFMPAYYAGGFQGGRAEDWIKAMKAMKKHIEDDFNQNYVAIWNDESHWNRYLLDNTPDVVLEPSYIYPDSLIAQYYVPLWGRNYSPKIMTLTKSFTTTKEGGDAVRKLIAP